MREYTKERMAADLGDATAEYWFRVQREAMVLASRPDPKRLRAAARAVEAAVYKEVKLSQDRSLATEDEVGSFFSSMGGYCDT